MFFPAPPSGSVISSSAPQAPSALQVKRSVYFNRTCGVMWTFPSSLCGDDPIFQHHACTTPHASDMIRGGGDHDLLGAGNVDLTLVPDLVVAPVVRTLVVTGPPPPWLRRNLGEILAKLLLVATTDNDDDNRLLLILWHHRYHRANSPSLLAYTRPPQQPQFCPPNARQAAQACCRRF